VDEAMSELRSFIEGTIEDVRRNSDKVRSTSATVEERLDKGDNISATATDTTSTISPTITCKTPDTTSSVTELFIYEEEEEFTLTPKDENFLSTEDHEFVDSIRSSTFSGIFLPSLYYDISKYSMSPEPTLSNVEDSASASSDITIIVQKSFTCQPFSNVIEFHLVAEYIFNSRLSIDIINRYIIFIWDPGISFTMYYFIPILRSPR